MTDDDPYPGNDPAYLDDLEDDVLSGAAPRIFISEPGRRTFVWSKIGWLERLEGENGAVEFSPVADSEEELRAWLRQSDDADLTEIDDGYAEVVRDEFDEQSPLYPEAPELSNQ